MVQTLRRAFAAFAAALAGPMLAALSPSALAQTSDSAGMVPVPASQGFIADMTGRLTKAEREHVIEAARQPESETGAQLFTLIVDHTDPETIEDYAQRVFTTWKPGRKGVDDGLLMLFALNNSSRKMRMQVGYGLEGKPPDVTVKRILAEQVRSALEKSGPAEAANVALQAVRSILNPAGVAKTASADQSASMSSKKTKPAGKNIDTLEEGWLLLGIALQIVTVVIAGILLTRRLPRWFKLVIAVAACVAMATIYFYAGVGEWRSWLGVAWILVAIAMVISVGNAVSGGQAARKSPQSGQVKHAKHAGHGKLAKRQAKSVGGKNAANPGGLDWMIPLTSLLAIVACASAPGEVALRVIAGLFWLICGCALCCLMIHSLFPSAARRGGGSSVDGWSSSSDGGFSSGSSGGSSDSGSSSDSGGGGDSGGGASSE